MNKLILACIAAGSMMSGLALDHAFAYERNASKTWCNASIRAKAIKDASQRCAEFEKFMADPSSYK